jgi:hypothetical protein
MSSLILYDSSMVGSFKLVSLLNVLDDIRTFIVCLLVYIICADVGDETKDG